MGKHRNKQHDEWLEAKRRCRLSDEEVRMAKELGFKPRSLIKNIPSRSQPWKASVSEWIRGLYERRFGESRKPEPIRNPPKANDQPTDVAHQRPATEDLLPQYDTDTGDIYYTRASNDKILSLEEAGQYLLDQDPERDPDDGDDFDDLDEGDFEDDVESSQREVDGEDQSMLRRQKHFRLAAEAVAAAMSLLPEVEKVALFGSVAKPLEREVPRFRKFRRMGVEIRHECKDVDLAVWVGSLRQLKTLQRARSQAFNELMAHRSIGVAHHQVDVFLLGNGTNRYLGRLCIFGQCPKGKRECGVTGCGAAPFLQQHEGFTFDWLKASKDSVVLYEKKADAPAS